MKLTARLRMKLRSLSPVFCGPGGRPVEGGTVTQRALHVGALLLGVLAPSPALAGHADVVILPLSGATGSATRLTQDACAALAVQLGKLKVSATVADPTPAWEELAASANTSGARLTIGVQVSESISCPMVAAPTQATTPSLPATPDGPPHQQAIRAATEAARMAESASLAAAIARQGRWCSSPPTRPEAYVLSNVLLPVVVVTLPSAKAAHLSSGVAATLAQAVRREHP
jgi:hypothetical protein